MIIVLAALGEEGGGGGGDGGSVSGSELRGGCGGSYTVRILSIWSNIFYPTLDFRHYLQPYIVWVFSLSALPAEHSNSYISK